jgi:hypothetical protein
MFSVSSNCAYRHPTMSYSAAAKYSKSTPCTNVPLHCPFCPTGLNGQQQTFWKYNLIHHMTLNHLTSTNELPALPGELLVASFISRAEETGLGVPGGKTQTAREDTYNLHSDDIKALEMEIARKRAYSSVSQASQTSATRDPSPTKRGRQ